MHNELQILRHGNDGSTPRRVLQVIGGWLWLLTVSEDGDPGWWLWLCLVVVAVAVAVAVAGGCGWWLWLWLVAGGWWLWLRLVAVHHNGCANFSRVLDTEPQPYTQAPQTQKPESNTRLRSGTQFSQNASPRWKE